MLKACDPVWTSSGAKPVRWAKSGLMSGLADCVAPGHSATQRASRSRLSAGSTAA